MFKTQIVICFAFLIALSSAVEPIYSRNGVLSGDDLRFSDNRIKDCVLSCPTQRSLLVVCGTDGKSYSNGSRVKCVDKCLKPFGEGVQVAFDGFCPNDVPPEERNQTKV